MIAGRSCNDRHLAITVDRAVHYPGHYIAATHKICAHLRLDKAIRSDDCKAAVYVRANNKAARSSFVMGLLRYVGGPVTFLTWLSSLGGDRFFRSLSGATSAGVMRAVQSLTMCRSGTKWFSPF